MIEISKDKIPHIIVTLGDKNSALDVALSISRDIDNGLWFSQFRNWSGAETIGYAEENESLDSGVFKFETMVDAYVKAFAGIIGSQPIIHRITIPVAATVAEALEIINNDECCFVTDYNENPDVAKGECLAKMEQAKRSRRAGLQ